MGWGKTGPAHSSPPPSIMGCNLSIYFSALGFNYSYTESEHSWLTYLKEKFKLQSFSQMILLNRGWGKTGPAHSFPPQKSSYLSIYLFSLLDYATLWMYLNNFELPIPKWELSFLTYNVIGTSTLSDGERLGRPILPPPLHNVWIFQFIF